MKKVLILNCGSSSLKWSLLDAGNESVLLEGQGNLTGANPKDQETIRGVLRGIPPVDAVGHRIVHGGALFQKTIRIDPESRARLESLVELDPLHMRSALLGIDEITSAFPGLPQFAAFDTAFHANLPETTGYALPPEWIKKWGIRRFGFHGLSVAYSTARAAEWMGRVPERLVVCHLGSGSSVTAVKNGRSIDTSMGFTPLEGLVMSTRAGSIDAGLLLHLQLRGGLKPRELLETLSHGSGLLGVSGISGDLREVMAAADQGSSSAILAYGQLILSARRSIGAMMAVLGGMDTLVFTGGIGENQPRVRQDLISTLAYAGVGLDETSNLAAVPDMEISAKNSKTKILVIRAREDLTILRELLQRAEG